MTAPRPDTAEATEVRALLAAAREMGATGVEIERTRHGTIKMRATFTAPPTPRQAMRAE